MPDMLVKLYGLPDPSPERDALAAEGVSCRRAESYERGLLIEFTNQHCPRWGDEVAAAFAHIPPTLYISAEDGQVTGFAAYNVTRPDFFGPTLVRESSRKRGIGRVLLLQCLHALAAEGYAYAIIGGVGPIAFYERAVGATVIPGSEAGIYGTMLRREAQR
jgi:GNAT superfamily N-acetyltransferase